MHELTELIRQDMKPALGVTEPGAIAFAVAEARRHTHGPVRRIVLRLNSGMFKNAFTCGIPGSSEVGNAHAAALGAVGADPDKGLECLDGVTQEQARQAKEMVAAGMVQVEVAGYGSSTREVSATRSYPNLASQDTANIPKTIEDNGRTLTLQNISWQTDNTANTDGYAMGDRFTAVATYTGSATSSYVTGYTVTADYSGTVSRIALNKTRYVAIFEGTAIEPLAPLPDSGSSPVQFNWAYILVPLGVVFAAGGVIGGCLLYKRKHESEEETE